ncbi:glycosyltransferase [Vibrio sp. VPAP30]|uniref:glycosyltransferase n=1 Tax=Vibrio sp. VPAP30 TaxID=1647102 RepID=UPI00065A0717|nr:glycosyltransferase [Vibrio sp. VPAP30]KLN63533.1 glycosyl transferase family 2 [Vibrio sp. VPAP30]
MAKLNNYDGIVCFGGADWWYHNKGHFDMKVMRELSKEQKVLFINSVGMRVPTLGKTSNIADKIKRKLKSISRGFVQVEDNFYVYSPIYVPGKMLSFLSNLFLKAQVAYITKKLGIRQPLMWVVTPTISDAIDLKKDNVVYQRTDKNEMLADGDTQFIKKSVDKLIKDSGLVIYCSKALQNEEHKLAKSTLHVSHGVADVFFDQQLKQRETELASTTKPKIMFVGAIDSHTFDIDLLLYSAKQIPDAEFFLVGEVSMGEHFSKQSIPKNIHFLGKKSQEEVPAYLHACDVLTMYWQKNEWIKFCSPVKFKEYLTAGKPIVSTFFNGWDEFGTSNIEVTNDYDEFVEHLRTAVIKGECQKLNMDRERWSYKAGLIAEKINEA